MKKLIAIAVLGLALGFSSLSFAFDHMDLNTKPIARNGIKNEIKGGYVEKDFTSFYTSQKTANLTALVTADQKSDDVYISIFGVQIPKS